MSYARVDSSIPIGIAASWQGRSNIAFSAIHPSTGVRWCTLVVRSVLVAEGPSPSSNKQALAGHSNKLRPTPLRSLVFTRIHPHPSYSQPLSWISKPFEFCSHTVLQGIFKLYIWAQLKLNQYVCDQKLLGNYWTCSADVTGIQCKYSVFKYIALCLQ